MKYLDKEKVEKFYRIVDRLSFYLSELYKNRSERDVFVERYSRKFKRGMIIVSVYKESDYAINGVESSTRRCTDIYCFYGFRYSTMDMSGRWCINLSVSAAGSVLLRKPFIFKSEYDIKQFQYRYLTEEELKFYLSLYSDEIEKENVIRFQKGLSNSKIENLCRKYGITKSAEAMKMLRSHVKYCDNSYVPLGNTGRFDTNNIYAECLEEFNVLNENSVKEK